MTLGLGELKKLEYNINDLKYLKSSKIKKKNCK